MATLVDGCSVVFAVGIAIAGLKEWTRMCCLALATTTTIWRLFLIIFGLVVFALPLQVLRRVVVVRIRILDRRRCFVLVRRERTNANVEVMCYNDDDGVVMAVVNNMVQFVKQAVWISTRASRSCDFLQFCGYSKFYESVKNDPG